MLMGMCMRACGLMIKLMGGVYTLIWMELNMKGVGEKINSMVKVKNLGQMVLSTMVTM